MVSYFLIGFVILLFFSGIRIINQYERAVKFRLGKFVEVLQPGFRWIIPILERTEKVDIRVITLDIPSQEVMTQDNVPIKVNGVVFFRVIDTSKAVLEVEQYKFAISQLSQSSLRDMIGKADLDTVLAKREEIGSKIKSIVDKETDPWGLRVTDVKIKDIELPDNMKRAMAYQAEAERTRRAKIILAQAEKQAATGLLEAGQTIDKSPAALKLRLYQTLSEVATEKNSTILFPFPEEMFRHFTKKKEK
jgi:regulator of protease activity HflC (stomatin/prohibitin superfamily)